MSTATKPSDWMLIKPGEWIEDRIEFPGAALVHEIGDKVTVFFPENMKGFGGLFRFRRIKGKLVRTG